MKDGRPLLSRGHRTGCICVLVACISLAAPAAAQAVTYYVDENDSNCSNTSGAGTSTQPFCTISAAATKAVGGSTVIVRPGTYDEQVRPRSGAADNPVVFKAEPAGGATVRGGQYGFYLSNKSWVDVEGFNVTETVSDGFHVSSGANNMKLIGNTASFAGEPVSNETAKGISVTDSRDILVQGNLVERNSNYGIYLVNSTRVTIVGNHSRLNARVFSRAASGIRVHSSSGNTIASNVSHDNEDSGIELVSGSDNNLVVNNLSYDNGDHGIDCLDVLGTRIVGNSVHRNVTAGINAEGGSTSTLMANNISVDNGVNSPRTKGNLRVDSTSGLGTTIDYDLVHLSEPGTQIIWGSASYSSLSAFVGIVGQERHGIEADPAWQDVAGGDFSLTAFSPAIDSANSGASGQTSSDLAGNPRVDAPAVANTGAGPRPYDDRGAFEHQPQPIPPTAALSVSPDSGAVNLDVAADASGSTDADGPIASYAFDFGDGTAVGPQSGATAAHTYTEAGTYTVTVTVRDATGLESTATHEVTVVTLPPEARLSVSPRTGSIPLLATADASESTDPDDTPIESYTFDFGDGSAAVGPQPQPTASHTYLLPGTYTVTVTVRDTAGNTSTASADVTAVGANQPPTAALSVSPESGMVDLHVDADASGSTDPEGAIVSYTFDFADGTPVVGPQPGPTASHVYRGGGTFDVTVTVEDDAGLRSTATRQVTVEDPVPVAALEVGPSSGRVPLDVTADASDSADPDGKPIESYTFDFGDSTPVVGPQTRATATHTYTTDGTFTVAVTVADAAGQTSTATRDVTVHPNIVSNPGFETGLEGWNTAGGSAGVVLSRELGGHSGDWEAKLVNGNITSATCTLNDSPNWVKLTSPGTYVAALWVRGDQPGALLKLRLREYSGTTLVGQDVSSVTLSTDWQEVTVARTPGAAGASTLDYSAYVIGAAPGTCFRADDATIDIE